MGKGYDDHGDVCAVGELALKEAVFTLTSAMAAEGPVSLLALRVALQQRLNANLHTRKDEIKRFAEECLRELAYLDGVAQNEDSIDIQPVAWDVRLNTGRGRQLFTEWHDETGSVNRWRGVWELLGKQEFSKEFCKNDKVTQDLHEGKIQSLATVVKKFSDNDGKENDKQEARVLQNKAATETRIAEIDCERGWGWMSARAMVRMDAATTQENQNNIPLKHAYKLPKPIMEKFLTRPLEDFSNRVLCALREKFASKTGHVAKEAQKGAESRSKADAGEFKTRKAPESSLRAAPLFYGADFQKSETTGKRVESLEVFFRAMEILQGLEKQPESHSLHLNEDILANIAKIPSDVGCEFMQSCATAVMLTGSVVRVSFDPGG